jgi:hypothetical protein
MVTLRQITSDNSIKWRLSIHNDSELSVVVAQGHLCEYAVQSGSEDRENKGLLVFCVEVYGERKASFAVSQNFAILVIVKNSANYPYSFFRRGEQQNE